MFFHAFANANVYKSADFARDFMGPMITLMDQLEVLWGASFSKAKLDVFIE